MSRVIQEAQQTGHDEPKQGGLPHTGFCCTKWLHLQHFLHFLRLPLCLRSSVFAQDEQILSTETVVRVSLKFSIPKKAFETVRLVSQQVPQSILPLSKDSRNSVKNMCLQGHLQHELPSNAALPLCWSVAKQENQSLGQPLPACLPVW